MHTSLLWRTTKYDTPRRAGSSSGMPMITTGCPSSDTRPGSYQKNLQCSLRVLRPRPLAAGSVLDKRVGRHAPDPTMGHDTVPGTGVSVSFANRLFQHGGGRKRPWAEISRGRVIPGFGRPYRHDRSEVSDAIVVGHLERAVSRREIPAARRYVPLGLEMARTSRAMTWLLCRAMTGVWRGHDGKGHDGEEQPQSGCPRT